MALADNDKEWIKRLVEGVSDSFAQAVAGEIGPLRTTLKETLSVQKQTLDAQEKLRTDIKTELPRALANVIQPKLDEQTKKLAELEGEVAKLKAAVFGGNGAKK